jgi:RecQ family ATP-dependent DNA helicase
VTESEALLSHLEALASKHFQLESLRPRQREVFLALQQHRQVLAMLPTGSGKTLLYALGSLLFKESVTIVICPLIALMRDQVQRMVEAGIETVAIYSEQDENERRKAFASLLQQSVRLLFVSPERFCLAGFQKLIRRLRLGMVVVDEAHCVVTWGHSFRPEYSQLAVLLKDLRVPRILALTATASTPSRRLMKEMVFPESDAVYEVLDRPLKDNIDVDSIRVFSEDERWSAVLKILQESNSRKSILYFTRREMCQKAALELRKQGYNSVVYHAGLNRESRRSVEEYLRESKRPVVICATLAFGMGIDLPDVQLIVVVGFPGNIEEMFQMMGRAGRKGEPSRAVIVWSGSDPKKRSFQFEKLLPHTSETRKRIELLSTVFPGKRQSVLCQKTKIQTLIKFLMKSSRDIDSSLQSLLATLSMLGCGGGLDSTRSSWMNLTLSASDRLTELLAELPVGISRRRLVLEWIQQRVKSEVIIAGPFRISFSMNEVVEDLRVSESKIIEVLRHYSEKKHLDFELIPVPDAQHSVLLRGSLDEALASIPRYQRWRSALELSLQALSSFVTDEKCRMTQAEAFFLPRIGAFADNRAPVCGRCDLCRKNAVKLSVHSEQRAGIAGPLTVPSPESLR